MNLVTNSGTDFLILNCQQEFREYFEPKPSARKRGAAWKGLLVGRNRVRATVERGGEGG